MSYALIQSKHTEKLEELIDSEFELTRIPVRVEAFARPLHCYGNVEQKIQKDGGRIQYGWAIIENEIMCEAEHHAVWENPEGTLVDITPKPQKINHILFIPDDRYIYDGRVIDNIRINKTTNPVVDDLIKIAEVNSIILASGTRSADDRVQLDYNEGVLYGRYQQIGRIVTLHALAGRGPNGHCICGSGKLYVGCHGAGLNEMIQSDKSSVPDNTMIIDLTRT